MECSLQTNLCSAFLLPWEYNTSKAQFQAQYSLTIRMSKIFIVFQTKVLCFYTYLLFIVFFEKSILKCIYFLCRYWCSTKVDDQLEHVGGQGNWGFCRQSCPPIALVTTTTPKPTTTTASEVSEAANRGDFLKLHYDSKLVHF